MVLAEMGELVLKLLEPFFAISLVDERSIFLVTPGLIQTLVDDHLETIILAKHSLVTLFAF